MINISRGLSNMLKRDTVHLPCTRPIILPWYTSETFELEMAINNLRQWIIIAGEIVSAAADAYVDAWWSATGAALFGACGWLTMNGWRDVPPSPRRTHAQAVGICAIVTATILAIDAILAICSAHREDTSSRTCSKSQHRVGHPW